MSVALLAGAAVVTLVALVAPPVSATLRHDGGIIVFGYWLTAGQVYFLPWMVAGFPAGAVATYVVYRRGALGWRSVVAHCAAIVGLIVGARWQYRLEYLPVREALSIRFSELGDSGMRLPLGIAVGMLCAGAICLVTRAPWREIGDGLASFFSTFIPVGRIGCLLAGCCMGTTCPPWGRWFCLRYPPGTEAFIRQAEQGLVAPDAAWSLPAFPLPLYFALASLLTLGVLLWLLHRNAAPGALLAAFCILRPLAKLALEPLRADPRPGLLMLGIPLASLTITSVTLIIVRWRSTTQDVAPALPRQAT